MLDKTDPLSAVTMICQEPPTASVSLPDGYSFTFFQREMETDWCRIQCSVEHFPNAEASLKAFHSEFSRQPALLEKRIVFVCDSIGRPVATGCLWPGNELDIPMERLHWLAVVPGLQGRGIGKALLAKLAELYRAEGCTGGIYLFAQAANLRAIGIFRQFGFKPYMEAEAGLVRIPGVRFGEKLRSEWQSIDEKLGRRVFSGTEAGEGSGGSVDKGAPAMFFEHKTMFGKCRSCKVFEISAPTQSGYTPHFHDYSQIWYVTRGSCEHVVEGQQYEMFVGDAFLLPPKVTHTTLLREGASIIGCEFYMEELLSRQTDSYDRFREITQNISFTMLFQRELYCAQPKFTFSHKGQRAVEKLMHSMLEEYTGEEEFYEDYLHLQILELLLIFAREYKQFPSYEVSEKIYDKYRSMVETAIQYIDGHYEDPLTLDEICRISMVSKTYFCYLFKMLTGQTFVEYLTNLRISKAMELLRNTDRSVIDIAQSVGFRDSTHFSRTFKHLKGISPRQYRFSSKHL